MMLTHIGTVATTLLTAPLGLTAWTSGHRGNTVMEEKVSYIFKLNAQRRQYAAMFDAVAGAALVLADGDVSDADRSAIVVAALIGSPDNNIVVMTDLVMTICDAIAAGERGDIEKLIECARPRDADATWATAGKMVEIVRRVRGLDDNMIDRLIPAIRRIGEHPLFLGFPAADGA